MAYWERPEFIAMQRDWYARLARDGFVDVEEHPPSSRTHRHRHDVPRRMLTLIVTERRVYHRFLTDCLETATFKRDADQVIMRMRAEGARINEICAKLAELNIPKTRCQVRFRIRIHEMKWGLRTYTRQQLGRKAG